VMKPAHGGSRADAMDRAAAIRSIVSDVIAEAVHSAGAGGVVVLDDWTPEGELSYEWLVGALGEARVWRGASLASNVHGVEPGDTQLLGALRFARDRAGLIAHPATKTALLLGGALPRADVFPLGDLYASQVTQLAGGWTVPDALATMLRRMGGVEVLDAALARLVDRREPAPTALAGLDADDAGEVIRLYERGRWHRLRPRLVPRLSARTLGVDLFD
ncbi:MAG: hypothetical protein ACREK1_08620, partial [Longimicrobiales bacterium]